MSMKTKTYTIEKIQKKYFDRKIPWSVHWELTYQCNMKCVHCYTDIKEKPNHLTLSQIEDIANQLREIGTISIILSGGELFSRGDIMDILDILCRHFVVTILTNATMIDSERAKRLKKLKVTQLEISLYAVDEGIHDAITGLKGSHAQTLSAIHHLKDAGVKVVIKSVIMKQNIEEYPNLFEFARSLGVDFRASPSIIPRLDSRQDTYNFSLKDEELKQFFSHVHNSKDGKNVKSETVKEQPFSKEIPICSAGHSMCSITPEGDLKLCTILPVKLGNLLEQSFEDVWLNKPKKIIEDMRKYKLSDLSKCKNCGLISECAPCPGLNYLESGNMLTTAEEFCEVATTGILECR